MNIYQEEVMDHYEHPRNQGELSGDGVRTDRDSNASCGDMVQFQLRVMDGVIKEVRWKGIGCAITTASASKLSNYLQGQSLKVIQEMSEEELLQKGVGFEVNPGREKCLSLPVKVVKKLVEMRL